jgi:hypothetical protein
MMRNPAKKNVAQGKSHARPPFGELTCSEGQVEDMLSAGESTEEERISPPKPIEHKPLPHNTLVAIRKRGQKDRDAGKK